MRLSSNAAQVRHRGRGGVGEGGGSRSRAAAAFDISPKRNTHFNYSTNQQHPRVMDLELNGSETAERVRNTTHNNNN